ncbi:hypothetical protein [Flavilitoribacter nigricans]|uniref:Uncharacterized protein n=1 Tax=Flavilitoribacter nigricans (strain ATCC 23147 / DSM 23189 / NBRC 102662 / NCIMB 1420 / SS-2) TaxID=1122177 RepID=A0A2D0N5H3_FLAN2|nr:hypothetical protein [Flavilitoribacter nigricans]PHN03636.1 hypothetical protein CRP01_25600 [Flavilitoribacter nigricans DSM 23189 = NBRC 102662]
MKSCLTFLALLATISLAAQATGRVDYKHLGLSFTVPAGWMGQEAEMGYLIASNTIPGLLMLLPHDQPYSLQQLKEQAQAGLSEANGTNLQLSGPLTELSKNAVGGTFTGTLEWQPAKAYIIGMSNPHGYGITILSITTSEQYSDQYPEYAKSIMKSVTFIKPESKEDINEWKDWMKNVKLTYMESYSSVSPGADGMTGGGYSLSRELDLCGAGYFNYYGSSNISTGSDSASAYNNSNSKGNGSWDIRVGPAGDPELVLQFNDGSTSSYTLTYKDQKLYLNGTRYFRTTQGEYAPSCN